MANDNFDVFISYSSKNKNVADAIVSEFETNGIKCWYAPRDIMPGEEWVTAITRALENCKLQVLVYTEDSNTSRQVMNEVAVAFNAGKTIVPFRLSEEKMSSEFEYYLTRVHWLDAITPPLQEKIVDLREYVDIILSGVDTSNLSRNAVKKQKPEKTEPKKKSKKKIILPVAIIGALCAVAALILVAVLLAAAIIGIGGSGKRNLKKGIEAYYSEYEGTSESKVARGYLEKAAKKGKADAYYYLGKLDEREYDYISAKENYEKGVENGSNLARLELGSLYENGCGVYPDLVKAISLYDESMAKGCPEAYFYEGNFYIRGYLDYEDGLENAVEYLEKSTGSTVKEVAANSYMNLGYIYENGLFGVEKDTSKALEYFENAIDVYPYCTGDCCYYIAELYLSEGDFVNSDIYYNKSLDFYMKSADKGNAYSMICAGYTFQEGVGVETDYEKAMDYYRKAADLNIPEAICDMGILYEYGNGNVKQDFDKAYEWYTKAADMNYPEAMKRIGDMYLRGEYGVKDEDKNDYNSARSWYEKAVANGCLNAYVSLGTMYEYGFGSDTDYDKAYELFKKSAEHGDSEAMWELGNLFQSGYLPEDTENTALGWFEKSALSGNIKAMISIGSISEQNGDYSKAEECYTFAASRNDAEAMRYLGWMYFYGEVDGTPDYENAYKWLKKAMDAGDWTSKIMIADMLMDGLGVNQNRGEAKQLYEEIENEGYADKAVYFALGSIYYDDIEVPRDDALAILYFEKSAGMGYTPACDKLGMMYFYGYDVGQDYSKAYYYLQMAADNEDASANTYKLLGDMYNDGIYVTMNSETAKKYYLVAEDKGLEDADMFGKLGIIYYLSGYYSSSAAYFEKSADLSEDPEQMYNAGCAYYTLGYYQKALLWFGKALEYDYDRSDYLKQDIRNMVNEGLITEEDAEPYLN
ncbi:MAG: SEL1-like repeat protein [Lachnospiraceae bacterium]|nr:SEL1-like repeat protein [Lachnospiraceae bacterium]MBR5066327.1 SEL1-like repeat protein [Lachnospiraceae bacterium]MBR5917474.1 SEL1-like repeat protein [Lachnospiraceae bacterium]